MEGEGEEEEGRGRSERLRCGGAGVEVVSGRELSILSDGVKPLQLPVCHRK